MSLFSPFSSAISNFTTVMNLSPTVMPPCVFFLCRIACVIALSTLHPWAIRWRTRLIGILLSFAVSRSALMTFIPITPHFDSFLDVKFTFFQIFNRRAFILKSSNIFQCTDSVKTTSFFHAELSFSKSNNIDTTSEIMKRFINLITQSQTPPESVFQSHQQCVSTLRDSDNVCHS